MSEKASMPGRLSRREESHLKIQALNDPANLRSLDRLQTMLCKCFGNKSSNVVLQNEAGGVVTATSNCERLLRALPVNRPITRLVTTAVQGHLANYSDGGLFTALLSLSLVQSALALTAHRHLTASVYELLLEECMGYLKGGGCLAKVKINFSSTAELLKLVRSVVASKPGCLLSEEEINQISRLVLISFISSIGEKDVPKLHIQTVDGVQAMASETQEGFLYMEPDLPEDRLVPIKCRTFSENGRDIIRTILLGASMAGDSDDFIDAQYEVHGPVRKSQIVLNQLKKWIDCLVDEQVGVVMCQKVVHPELKEYMKERNILVMERLGTSGVRAAETFTGGALVQTPQSAVSAAQCGRVAGVQHVLLHERSYLQLREGGGAPMSTLLLCHFSEDALDELKASCEQGWAVLRQALSQPHALLGGGCWLTVLAAHIEQQAPAFIPSWREELECPNHHLHQIISSFTASLRQVCSFLNKDKHHYVDSQHRHHWQTPRGVEPEECTPLSCQCGMFVRTEDSKFVPFEELRLSEHAYLGERLQGLTANEETEANSEEEAFNLEVEGLVSSLNLCNKGNRITAQNKNRTTAEITKDETPVVLDGFTAFSHALQTGILTANMVISVANVITDCN